MTKYTLKNVPFKWDEKCQRSLKLVKEHLQSAPMMIYLDKSKPFHLFTDSSNFTWSSVLMQTDSILEMETSFVPLKRKEEDTDKSDHKERHPLHIFQK